MRSDDGIFPTQMPPAISREVEPVSAGREEIMWKPGAGEEGEAVFVSTRQIMSNFRSRDVSSRSVRLCSLVCWPLAFQNNMETSPWRGRRVFFSGGGVSIGVRFERLLNLVRQLCQFSSMVILGYLRACVRISDEMSKRLRLIGVVGGL